MASQLAISPLSRGLGALLCVLALACDGAGGVSGGGAGAAAPMHTEPGATVALALTLDDQTELDALEHRLAALEGLSADELLERRAVSYAQLGYDPSAAHNLDLIQASPLALNEAELSKLSEQGFVIAPRQAFPNMAYGYTSIYSSDLPVYISADAILDAVHLSYDAILKRIEEQGLIAELRTLLQDARRNLEAGAVADPKTAADVDLYLAVALSLLEDAAVEPVAGASAAQLSALVERAKGAEGIEVVTLFGVDRQVDFSQFEPRGHYTDSETLERYFRAMIWLGRTDFRLIETLGDGEQVFRRRQLQNVLALRDVITGTARSAFARIDATVSAFVGEHDYMQLPELDALLEDLGASTGAELLAHDDATLAQAIVAGGYGAQRIASQVIFKAPSAPAGALPLSRSFALLGQRYVVDSHVFSNVVYDRVPRNEAGIRHLPDPLDAAYAALANPAALPLLETGLRAHDYAPHLERMRVLVDEHSDGFWGKNLYNVWLSALRALSPAEGAQEPSALGMPSVTGTEAWSRRVLSTQLASWAQLRHDTILYAKQSYTTGVACEFPDAYVDPYPEVFERIAQFAEHGHAVAGVLASGAAAALLPQLRAYFDELRSVASILKEMAEHQRTGTPFSDVQMAFINDAVRSRIEGCGGPIVYEGWYSRLLFDRSDEDMDPTVADVHTHPGDTPAAAVLHVATGLPRLMVMTAETCEGPRAYVGVAFAYHEVVTGLDRLTDPEWATMAANAKDVPWMEPILP